MADQNPVGRIVQEIRDGLQADGYTWPVKVRGGRRMEGDATTPGDSPPLVVVRVNSRVRTERIAHARWRITVVTYETDPRLAMLLDVRVSEILQSTGPRFTLGKIPIYRSAEDVGGQPGEDPDTNWSTVTSIYIIHAATGTP